MFDSEDETDALVVSDGVKEFVVVSCRVSLCD